MVQVWMAKKEQALELNHNILLSIGMQMLWAVGWQITPLVCIWPWGTGNVCKFWHCSSTPALTLRGVLWQLLLPQRISSEVTFPPSFDTAIIASTSKTTVQRHPVRSPESLKLLNNIFYKTRRLLRSHLLNLKLFSLDGHKRHYEVVYCSKHRYQNPLHSKQLRMTESRPMKQGLLNSTGKSSLMRQ